MSLPIPPLKLSAHDWRFLADPEKYVQVSEKDHAHKLFFASTRRQFLTVKDILTRLNGSNGEGPMRGVLLADDVGLGKTSVAALVAWAFAGSRTAACRVRILAPNDTMVRRWKDELSRHVCLLGKCAKSLKVDNKQVKDAKTRRLNASSIQVVKHSYASAGKSLECDLLIVDEAHRAKGENSAFYQALQSQLGQVKRILILTATPFSIQIDELTRLLELVGAHGIQDDIRRFNSSLKELDHKHSSKSPDVVARQLTQAAIRAVEGMKKWLIRFGIDDLPRERKAFGEIEALDIPVPSASPTDIELILRMDRALRIAKKGSPDSPGATNDPRFHVGWRHLDAERANLLADRSGMSVMDVRVIEHHRDAIDALRCKSPVHPKISAVSKAVLQLVEQGEKVVIFCRHHLTAQELTAHIGRILPISSAKGAPPLPEWQEAWSSLFPDTSPAHFVQRKTFVKWLCSKSLRAQVWSWIVQAGRHQTPLIDALKSTSVRGIPKAAKIDEAAQELFATLMASGSSKRVLGEPGGMPGEDGTVNVVGICEHGNHEEERKYFSRNAQPDTIISTFNSPFGPQVLVATDMLSEGIDLHRYCRHLIHYELDPSPIRTIQRNGRIRRVGGWASVVGLPVMYAYPAFRGTRDERVVRIMKNRVDSFGLLLGGGHNIEITDTQADDEVWRDQVLAIAKLRGLSKLGKALNARDPRR